MKLPACLTLLAISSYLNADTLTILNWEDYLSDDVISAWEKKSGHTINQIYFDNDEERDDIVLNHKEKLIDLVVLDETVSLILAERKIIVPVSSYPSTAKSTIADKGFQDSCGLYSVPYLWGTLGIAYRIDKVSVPPKSWGFIFNPDNKLKGHIGLIDDFTDMLAPALIMQGNSVNSEKEDELKQAFSQIKTALPNILTFEYSISYVADEANRDDLHVALVYSGDQYSLNEIYGVDVWEYTTLHEGTVTWVDCLAVIADSPRKAIAYDFLSFINSPSVAAENSEKVYVASPYLKARELQSNDFLNDETVYPPKEVLNKAQNYEKLSPENMLLRNRITSSLVKLHDAQ